ncbi:hypothetical protein [Halapricum desulfuricans]|uniref:hypothetical protein n=1 Tax=Halapricum desulfuricans TaxID=2841257 RepID=UPI001E559209|nr:hypothetical protein [Halapricum desulfuricans]
MSADPAFPGTVVVDPTRDSSPSWTPSRAKSAACGSSGDSRQPGRSTVSVALSGVDIAHVL